MSLTAGTKLGPYEILAPLGAGGMGEVYRARDPRLARDVAIKVLPASFSADADRLRPFEHEAEAAGVLNHPNVTSVYDIGTNADGAPLRGSGVPRGRDAPRRPRWRQALRPPRRGLFLIVVPELELISVFTGWNIYDKPELAPSVALARVLAAVRR